MHDYPIFVFTALMILLYGLFSNIAEKSVITPPMVFVFIGLLASYFTFDFLKEGVEAPVVKIIA
ncbi:MAG: hypothetical protein KA322_03710, partial [Chitinophagales bacterium]|nr:hypothetical protein [Chitinophagales bacterium]